MKRHELGIPFHIMLLQTARGPFEEEGEKSIRERWKVRFLPGSPPSRLENTRGGGASKSKMKN